VPLFVEELTKTVLESGLLREEAGRYVFDRALPAFAIPTSLQASLLARLDRLASARPVAQIGAAIGRQFPYPLLRAVCQLPEDELQGSLAHLVASELVSQRGTPHEAVYSFKHAMVQDAAHDSLLRNARRQLHARIAGALETHYPELLDSQPELFAQHYAEAGLPDRSVAYWGKAAQRSAARFAMAEAAAQFQRGLDQLGLLPDTPDRQRQELELCCGSAAVLQTLKGDGASETGRAYAQALELWERLGSPAEFLHVPWGKSRYHIYHGEFDLALRLAEGVLHRSRQYNDSAGLVLGHYSSGHNLLLTGRFASCRSHLEEALALYDPIAHCSLTDHAGHHPQVNAQSLLGIVLLYLGYPDQALAQSSAAIAEARRLTHPPTLAASLANGSRLLSLAGTEAALNERADELVALATDWGFPFWGVLGMLYHGWVAVKRGDVANGISLLRSGSAAYRAAGAEIGMPYFLGLLARACEIAGQIEEAVTQLDDALQIADRTGARWFVPELDRHMGQLLLLQGHSEAAEEIYRKALAIADEQEAKLWELRAAASLARLLRDQGRRAEARDLLAPVYGWFTEGFGTPDLKEAELLLDELNGEGVSDRQPEPGPPANAGHASRQA